MSKKGVRLWLTSMKYVNYNMVHKDIIRNIERRKKIYNKNSVQKWIPFNRIFDDGLIQMKDNSVIKILKISPINYNLKSELEQYSILNSYKLFLKTCNFDIQILIQSNKENINKNIEKIKDNSESNSIKIKKLMDNYCSYIKKINAENKASTKKFYILIKIFPQNKKINNLDFMRESLLANYLKIKECLARCGNNVYEVNSKQEAEEILSSFLITKQYLKKFN